MYSTGVNYERLSPKDSAADRPRNTHCVSDGHAPAPAYSNGTRQATGLVSQARSANLLRSNRRRDQHVAADVNCTDTVEAGVHPAGTKYASAKATGGLPDDFHNASAHYT